METIYRIVPKDALLYVSFGLITTEDAISTYMFAVECNTEQTPREYTMDLLAGASNQQNHELLSVANLLAVQTTEYKQFKKLSDAADKVAASQPGDPTIVCHIRLQNQASKSVSTLSLIWHPIALNSMQAIAPLWRLLKNQEDLMC
jgi:hypothetical protein